MEKTITPRLGGLIEDALSTLRQAVYEGNHRVRQEPAPNENSPWDTPDLPSDVLDALSDALAALRPVEARARQAVDVWRERVTALYREDERTALVHGPRL